MENETKLLKAAVPLLVEWYRGNRREMPWRAESTPYHVWISEIMLQQTRIEAVIPYYTRFIRAFPTVEALAAAPDDVLTKYWEGLGYYSRVRNLKRAAEQIVSRYGGQLPREAETLKKLPGIGAYTAGAIASIAYGRPEPAVDGNVLRVIMRLTACADDIMSPKTRNETTSALRRVYPENGDASLLTEGLMELGEVICIPNGEPRCELCPVSGLCRAHLTGTTDRYPVRSPKKPRRTEERTVFLLSCGDRYAITRRGGKGLLAGMWEFPNTEGSLSQEQAVDTLARRGLRICSCIPCGKAQHIFTHTEWHMTGYRAVCTDCAEGFVWETAERIRRNYAVPTAFRFYLKQLSPSLGPLQDDKK